MGDRIGSDPDRAGLQGAGLVRIERRAAPSQADGDKFAAVSRWKAIRRMARHAVARWYADETMEGDQRSPHFVVQRTHCGLLMPQHGGRMHHRPTAREDATLMISTNTTAAASNADGRPRQSRKC
jgi:hypothetical protein